jgi:hypothetical protein
MKIHYVVKDGIALFVRVTVDSGHYGRVIAGRRSVLVLPGRKRLAA